MERDLGYMRILLITQWFDPEPTFKGLLFAAALRDMGHDVEVLTGFPNYPGGRIYDGYKQHVYAREYIDHITVHRVPLYPSHDSSAPRRIANYMSFSASATIASLLVRRPDVVYLYHPPATVAAAAMAMKFLRGVPFVLDVQDLWPDTLRATGMLNGNRALQIVRWGMNQIYGAAAHIVVLSPGFKNAIAPITGPRKITVVPNWADESKMSYDAATPHTRASDVNAPFGDNAFNDDAFNVVFAGTMGRAQALTTVLEAASKLANEGVRFVFVGSGIELDRLKREASAQRLSNVVFLPRRPVSAMTPILRGADALLVHLQDDPLFSITIPSKTQAYLMAGRPILMGVRGDAATLVQESGAGLLFEPENAESLAQAVRQIVRLDQSDRDAMGRRGANFYREQLSLAVGGPAIESVLVAASTERPRSDFARRLGDLMLAGIATSILAAPMAAVALLIRRRLGSPVLFRQVRPGRHDRPFQMLKFRTMSDEKDAGGRLLPDAERLTPLGARIRSLSLDELPTLLNVIRGEMSIVGPRPLLPRYTEYFRPEEARRLDVQPGVTGWAQVNGRNTVSWDARLSMDAWYVKNRSVALDVKIILKTIVNVIRRSGFVADPESLMKNLDEERRQPVAGS